MKISAYAALSSKGRLQPYTYEPAPLQPFEILIKTTHCGLCHSDVHLIDDDWKRSRYPLVPGHEVIGQIVEKGEAVHFLKLGERVGVSWIRSSCLVCPTCLSGDTNLCPSKTTTCNGHFGGFADHLVADARFSFPIPEGIDSAHAAPLLCAGATVYTPLRDLGIQPSHTVAVLGIGGLGHLALQFAKGFGCETSAISTTRSKEKDAKKFGADHFYVLSELPPQSKFDLILSTVHADLNWNEILLLLKPKGALCFLGRPASSISIEVAPLISGGRRITGSSTANRSHMMEMLEMAARCKIHPQIEVMPLSKVNKAIDRLKANEARYRIVLETHV
jgi:uncharacterized zinc-type alcohol dehydrogenase-like protein